MPSEQTTHPRDSYITGRLWQDARALLAHTLWILAVKVSPRHHPFTDAFFRRCGVTNDAQF